MVTLNPKVKLQANIIFPGTVNGGAGIGVNLANGSYTINLEYGDFMPPVTALPPDLSTLTILMWNTTTQTYQLLPVSTLQGAVTISPGNDAPLMDGSASPGISVLYSREDHVHPTDTSRAPLASPIFTGDPKAPTPAPGDADTSIATTAFVGAAITTAAILPSNANPIIDGTAAPGASALYSRGDHVHPTDTTRAPVANPTFTGDPKAPTPTAGDADTSIATTAFVSTAITNAAVQPATVAPIMDSVAAVGVSLLYARQDHVHPSDTTKAPLASPALTGSPTAPTQAANDNSTKIATTAYVDSKEGTAAPLMDGTAAVGTSHLFARQDHVHASDTSRMAVAGGQTITGGFRLTPNNLGTITTGTVTPDAFNGNYQFYTNNGAHTLAAPANDSALDILITNGASAGAITFSGFTTGTTGDALTTVSANKFILSIRRINAIATYTVKALQ